VAGLVRSDLRHCCERAFRQNAGVDLAKGRAKVIAINNSWRLAPWADALYGCDYTWWHANRGVPEFAGLKISQDAGAVSHTGIFT
jgi:hypothetical protein